VLAQVGGEGQARLLSGTVLLHGVAPLAAQYLAAGGLGRLRITGEPPPLAARDPSFAMERAPLDAAADVVLDLWDGRAWRAAKGKRIWGGAVGGKVLLGVEPRAAASGGFGDPAATAARAILETLAAGEALRLLLGLEPRRYEFA
jgi:hypothetical protein